MGKALGCMQNIVSFLCFLPFPGPENLCHRKATFKPIGRILYIKIYVLMENMNASKAPRDFFAPLGAGAKRSSATLSGERQRGAEKDPTRRRIHIWN
ncbi:MAG TPA: hypothetical protein PKE04_14385 [Clostridia bacterium]|nr:hypothetical protein [Clostridia bacterium]